MRAAPLRRPRSDGRRWCLVPGHRRRQLTQRLAGLLILLLAGHLLLTVTCVAPLSAHVRAAHATMAQIGDGTHDHQCDQPLASVVPVPDRPSLGQAVLPLLPAITGAVPATAITAPPPAYPRAMARALLQVYRI